jgi:phosphoribosylformylglycinamidine cyclo-ligase
MAISDADLNMAFDGATLGERLLEPTRIYVKPVLALLEKVDVHSLSHITGGGLLENLPRVMPENTRAMIQPGNWTQPAVFDWLQQQGNIEATEMYRTFNCGIGMVAVVDAADADSTIATLKEQGVEASQIGIIESSDTASPEVIILD